MRTATIGQLLVNAALPDDMVDDNRVLDKKGLKKLLQELAEKHPEQYREVEAALSKIGRHAAYTTGGNSFGIRHMQKSKAGRALGEQLQKQVMALVDSDMDDETRDRKIIELLAAAGPGQQQAIYQESLKEGNPLAFQVLSGSRGSPMNLASLLGSDLMYTDHRGDPLPVPVLRSFSQGLSPLEYWAGAYGARKGVIDTKLAVRDAGYLSKVLGQVAHRQVVTGYDDEDGDNEPDTPRGFPVDTDDEDSEGALLAQSVGGYSRNTPLTPKILATLRRKGFKRILVRSPAVGGAPDGGLYARDVGIREHGRLPWNGEVAGMVAAQALGEPLSQSSLSSKHGGGVAGASAAKAVGGFQNINSQIQIPKTIKGGAAHSQVDGVVQRIEKAPAGGHYVTVNDKKHYVSDGFELKVKKGDPIEAGDVLSEGIPNHGIIVDHKGVGEGRRYFVNALRDAYRDAGLPGNRRNIELVARGLINHVRLLEETEDNVPDDIVSYNQLENSWKPREGMRTVPVKGAAGKYLERPYLHYSIGTKVRPSVQQSLEEFGVKDIDVHDEPPPFEPQMIRGAATLQHDEDWITRMFGAGLKRSLLAGTHRGAVSDATGTSFVPGLARAVDFGQIGKVRTPVPFPEQEKEQPNRLSPLGKQAEALREKLADRPLTWEEQRAIEEQQDRRERLIAEREQARRQRGIARNRELAHPRNTTIDYRTIKPEDIPAVPEQTPQEYWQYLKAREAVEHSIARERGYNNYADYPAAGPTPPRVPEALIDQEMARRYPGMGDPNELARNRWQMPPQPMSNEARRYARELERYVAEMRDMRRHMRQAEEQTERDITDRHDLRKDTDEQLSFYLLPREGEESSYFDAGSLPGLLNPRLFLTRLAGNALHGGADVKARREMYDGINAPTPPVPRSRDIQFPVPQPNKWQLQESEKFPSKLDASDAPSRDTDMALLQRVNEKLRAGQAPTDGDVPGLLQYLNAAGEQDNLLHHRKTWELPENFDWSQELSQRNRRQVETERYQQWLNEPYAPALEMTDEGFQFLGDHAKQIADWKASGGQGAEPNWVDMYNQYVREGLVPPPSVGIGMKQYQEGPPSLTNKRYQAHELNRLRSLGDKAEFDKFVQQVQAANAPAEQPAPAEQQQPAQQTAAPQTPVPRAGAGGLFPGGAFPTTQPAMSAEPVASLQTPAVAQKPTRAPQPAVAQKPVPQPAVAQKPNPTVQPAIAQKPSPAIQRNKENPYPTSPMGLQIAGMFPKQTGSLLSAMGPAAIAGYGLLFSPKRVATLASAPLNKAKGLFGGGTTKPLSKKISGPTSPIKPTIG